jgi:hypothetical protein
VATDGPLSVYDVPAGELGFRQPRPLQQLDGTLYATLIWQANEDIPQQTYAVSLQLLDAAGQLMQQADYPLPDARPAGCIVSALPIQNVPAGEYDLFVIVYDVQNGIRLTAGNDDKIRLNSVVIE